jgi:hypothetical protein
MPVMAPAQRGKADAGEPQRLPVAISDPAVAERRSADPRSMFG